MTTKLLLPFFLLMLNSAYCQNKSDDLKVKETPKSVSQNEKLAPGKMITKFEFKDTEGKIYTLSSLKGKVVVLNFWFSTCIPCVEEIEPFNAVVEKYKGKDVVFISPTFEKEETTRKFIEKYHPHMNMSFGNKEYMDQLDLLYYPTNIILDKDGFIYKTFTGSINDVEKTLSEQIDFLLKL